MIFEIIDNLGKKIRLTNRQWQHINKDHPEITPFIENLKETLVRPDKSYFATYDENVRYYYKYHKESKRYILILVRYLNDDGFIITAYFVKNIK